MLYFVFVEHIGFWFDNIHCYGTETKTNANDKELDPPILVVCTGNETSVEMNEEV